MNTTEAYIQAAYILVAFGSATIQAIREMFSHAPLTEAELNTVIDAVSADATRRKALADADAGKNG